MKQLYSLNTRALVAGLQYNNITHTHARTHTHTQTIYDIYVYDICI